MTREEEIRERCEKATPGPWIVENEAVQRADGTAIAEWDYGRVDWKPENAEFVAHAREDIPWLLARVAELEAESLSRLDLCSKLTIENEALKAEVERLREWRDKAINLCRWIKAESGHGYRVGGIAVELLEGVSHD